MAATCTLEPHEPGFVFDNCKRNALIETKGFSAPKAQKTGTTIVGVIVKDAVVLGADTRATEGDIVADKCCKKIHYLAKNMHCCGAGTAADTEMTTKTISSQLQLLKLNTGRTVPVCAANRLLKQMLFRYQGHIGAALVLGGVDSTGPHLYSIHPHGSTDKLPYTTMGSGSLAALSVLDSKWKPDMSVEEGKRLVRDAISAGIFNDLGSGGSVDLCVIQSNSVEYLTPYEEGAIAMKGKRDGNYKYSKGTTAILAKKVKKIPLVVDQTIIKAHQSPEQPMEIS